MALFGVLGAACSSSETAAADPVVLSGTVAGTSFDAHASSGFAVTYPPNTSINTTNAAFTKLSIAFTTKASGIDYCGASIARKPDQDQILLQLVSNGEAIAPGTYTLARGSDFLDPGTFIANAAHLDAACDGSSDTKAEDASSGSITIQNVGESQVQGTLELTFPSGSAKGNFTAPTCTKALSDLGRTAPQCRN